MSCRHLPARRTLTSSWGPRPKVERTSALATECLPGGPGLLPVGTETIRRGSPTLPSERDLGGKCGVGKGWQWVEAEALGELQALAP